VLASSSWSKLKNPSKAKDLRWQTEPIAPIASKGLSRALANRDEA
jgi:hypothetical protein